MKKFRDYLTAIAGANRLNGFGRDGLPVEWLFHPGMLFSSMDKWWGDFGFRSSAHEGIDITYFRTQEGKLCCFDDKVLIPAMEDGRIINICDDFLGQTLVVEAEKQDPGPALGIYTYAHIRPDTRLSIGCCIKKNEIIARVCDTRKNPQLLPHLHFSCFEVEKSILSTDLNWSLFSNIAFARAIHPVFL